MRPYLIFFLVIAVLEARPQPTGKAADYNPGNAVVECTGRGARIPATRKSLKEIKEVKDLKITGRDFIFEKTGRFRDHYQIGTSLGSGKASHLVMLCVQVHSVRCVSASTRRPT